MKKVVLSIPKDKTIALTGFVLVVAILNFFVFLSRDVLLIIGVTVFDLNRLISGCIS